MDGQEKTAEAELIKVGFEPDGITVYVPIGVTVAKAAQIAGSEIELTCGGTGTCGKCRVEATGDLSEPDPSEAKFLTTEDLAKGVRLACRARIHGETTVVVPTTSRSLVQQILSHGIMHDVHVMPDVLKLYVELPKPSLEDERGEFERLAAGLTGYDVDALIGVQVAKTLPSILRGSDYKVTAVAAGNELIAVEPGNTVRKNYGVAFDLGSTTIAGYLMDLNIGHEAAVASAINPQMAFGDDLVSRINYAITEPNGLETLRKSVIGALNDIIRQLADDQGIRTSDIYEAVLVGNTCMTHLLLGLDVSTLGFSPYVPTVCQEMTLTARDAGLDICPESRVNVLPNVAGFVGSDLLAVVLSTIREDDGSTRLAVDIGTNGEMALIHDGKLFACSAAAGPAFEGARISCGMRGVAGAIDSVSISNTLKITTIENEHPIGLCGSGLVDAAAEMLKAGIIDSTGRMITRAEADNLPEDLKNRLINVNGAAGFALATKDESGKGEAIVLTQADIRQLQLAKGSIRAAIETLLITAGAKWEDLKEIYLAGAFGNYIQIESAIAIGLIPPIDVNRIIPVGNAAGAGAKLALISVKERERASRFAERIEHIELASHPEYQNEFMDNMLFPTHS